MLVEDNPDDEMLIRRVFQKNNLANEIIVAHDGAEALECLLGADSPSARFIPQVILLDLKLPKIDGLEVLRRLRADDRTRHLPVVILTSSDEDKDIIQSYRLGANSYVRKPVDFNEFAEAVRELGLYWLILNQPPQ
jgi:two-component system response regulator